MCSTYKKTYLQTFSLLFNFELIFCLKSTRAVIKNTLMLKIKTLLGKYKYDLLHYCLSSLLSCGRHPFFGRIFGHFWPWKNEHKKHFLGRVCEQNNNDYDYDTTKKRGKVKYTNLSTAQCTVHTTTENPDIKTWRTSNPEDFSSPNDALLWEIHTFHVHVSTSMSLFP